MSGCTVYPAIDVRGGSVVRLRQGDYARETRYDADPLALARRYEEAGATWLHVVDLDGARRGHYALGALLRSIKRQTGLRVQTGGGVRAVGDVAALLEAGADRVIVGSLAVSAPAMVAGWADRFGNDRLTVALDARRDATGCWRLPIHGWTESSGRRLDELLGVYAAAGIVHILCTDITRDGTLAGPNFELYADLLARFSTLELQASGGARSLSDVHQARAAGCAGIVLGRALLEGRLALADALRLPGTTLRADALPPAPC